MLPSRLLIGFVGGVGTCLLALKYLPVRVQFAWGKKNTIVDTAKNKLGFLHPQYCVKCKTNPCQDPFGHQYDHLKN